MALSITTGLETSALVNGDTITKTTLRPISAEVAQGYIADTYAYSEALEQAGYSVPAILGMQAVQYADGYRVEQRSRFVEGYDLAKPDLSPADRMDSMQNVVASLAQADARPDDSLYVPVDAKPDNFLRATKDGYTFMIDTMPPLIQADSDLFPYDRFEFGKTRAGRAVLKHYVSQKTGVITRFTAKTIQQEHGQPGLLKPTLVNGTVEELFAKTEGKETGRIIDNVRRGMPHFLARTTLNRVSMKLFVDSPKLPR